MAKSPDGILDLTPDLAFRFSVYGSVVAYRRTQSLRVGYPFFHLRREGFWQSLDEQRQVTNDRTRVRSVRIDEEFLSVAHDQAFRQRARELLIAKYFRPEERAALYALCGLAIPSEDEIALKADYQPLEDAKRKGREARFRVNVLCNYLFTCAMTQYRLTTLSHGSIVDAAHIHQFADSRNDDPRNGLALCKNAHWLFDNGLWTLENDYTVIVARGHFDEQAGDPSYRQLAGYHGQKIVLPNDESNWPDLQHIEWHRANRFRGLKR